MHSLHMSKPNVTRVQSATERTASVHTLHMSKPNVTRVQSGTECTASVLLRTAKCYSTSTPVPLCTTKSYSGTTPVLLRTTLLLRTTKYYSVLQSATPLLPQYYSVPQSTTLALHYKPKQSTSQPASQFGRPPSEHGAGRPAGPHGSGRPAGDEIANKSTVLSSFWKGLPNDLPEKLLRTNYKVLHSLLLCTAKYNTVLHAQYYSVLCSTTPYYLALFRKTKY